MSTPTYQVVGLTGTNQLKLIQVPLDTTFIGALNLQTAIVKPLATLDRSALLPAMQWGNPLAKQSAGNHQTLDKSNIDYSWRFFYPSNGKIPGSPIPNSGQLLPRPL